MTGQIAWKDGIPVSTRFDDPYYSLEDGLAESIHVFLSGNDLPNRLNQPLHIAELGFGTGLNLLATWQLWRTGPRHPLTFTTFEAYPLSREATVEALAAFPSVSDLADQLLDALPLESQIEIARGLTLHLIEGDARQTLPDWQGKADAWFLDGFSPAKNPELWDPALMAEVARHTAPNGTFATYTAAGHVRRALAQAGFAVDRRPGYGRKRHMSTGRL
ncbi:tRNA (5-methylaminomethyl-2-thiouridine)(34)-methyltransferase MnmD [Aestuariibius sp. 2305UL40-4]|uniref:tRNA (5-methylaminomethyl-2-thiouridine)(34)-methyltransferase MnmD n=1 Tax=Aestuariibius violaceus TaxID=3234132 RepID=UPI00345EB743